MPPATPVRLHRSGSLPGVRGCEQPDIVVKAYPIPAANAVLYVGMERHCAAAPADPEDAVTFVAPGLRVRNPVRWGPLMRPSSRRSLPSNV